jgi:hypothetical protein
VALAGCATAPPETPAERVARQGPTAPPPASSATPEAYRLCLLLQEQNERLAALERRLAFIEQDVRFPRFGGFYGYGPYFP